MRAPAGTRSGVHPECTRSGLTSRVRPSCNFSAGESLVAYPNDPGWRALILALAWLAGHQAMRLVMESARISAQDALAFGLLDEIVEEAGLVDSAIAIVHRWTLPGAAIIAHLQLLRPPLAAVEQAIAAETEAAHSTDQADIARTGINQFFSRRNDAPTGSSHPPGDPAKARS